MPRNHNSTPFVQGLVAWYLVTISIVFFKRTSTMNIACLFNLFPYALGVVLSLCSLGYVASIDRALTPMSHEEQLSTVGGQDDFYTDQCIRPLVACPTCIQPNCVPISAGLNCKFTSTARDGCSATGNHRDCTDTVFGSCDPNAAAACGSSMTPVPCPPRQNLAHDCTTPAACVSGGSAWCNTCI
ncbi:hypothetical protein Pla110_24560 [Polystyrenella longa]|uniref:Uncharacterized protein n=1 Tax=Polystyrenella longa TaxID=2528007 RepID=A0A518CND4_9PLAN|nr:hypothetical protein Pla110_24560 [Polystyrenella longa]